MVQLDHMTRGRAMLGVGPGALPSDAFMVGIDPATARTTSAPGCRADGIPGEQQVGAVPPARVDQAQ